MGFRIPKIWQIMKHFARSFHQAQTSYFWSVNFSCEIELKISIQFDEKNKTKYFTIIFIIYFNIIGPQHQAGSDSLLTGQTFFKMKEMFFEDDIDDSKYCGHLYGLGTNFVVSKNNNSSSASLASQASSATTTTSSTVTTSSNEAMTTTTATSEADTESEASKTEAEDNGSDAVAKTDWLLPKHSYIHAYLYYKQTADDEYMIIKTVIVWTKPFCETQSEDIFDVKWCSDYEQRLSEEIIGF